MVDWYAAACVGPLALLAWLVIKRTSSCRKRIRLHEQSQAGQNRWAKRTS